MAEYFVHFISEYGGENADSEVVYLSMYKKPENSTVNKVSKEYSKEPEKSIITQHISEGQDDSIKNVTKENEPEKSVIQYIPEGQVGSINNAISPFLIWK